MWSSPPFPSVSVVADRTLHIDCSVTRIIDWAAALDKYAGPITGWNDLDMLEVGNGNMTHDEYGW